MDDNKHSVEMDFKYEKISTEYRTGHVPKSKKRKFEDDSSDNEQRRLVANSQERIRMQKINSALENLKKCLPEQFHLHHRRMSKIRTLRCAMMYIQNLSQLIHDDNMRRQEQYTQAIDYMKSMCDPRFTMRSPEVANPLDENKATAIPYYPYIGPLCTDSVSQMYQTPVPNHQVQMYQPRPLDFSLPAENKPSIRSVASSDTDHGSDFFTTGLIETTPLRVKQHIVPRSRRYTKSATPLRSNMLSTKYEPFTSPLLGLRNDNELNISFSSANSEHFREDQDEIQQPSSILSDIVAGSCKYSAD